MMLVLYFGRHRHISSPTVGYGPVYPQTLNNYYNLLTSAHLKKIILDSLIFLGSILTVFFGIWL